MAFAAVLLPLAFIAVLIAAVESTPAIHRLWKRKQTAPVSQEGGDT